ncbi:MFS transporter [Salmonella enterica]|uniref:MFS transporter n=1 Tax=Salmonella enterica TaxID=28901 RepID=UPI0015D0B1DE|nr:MFS transporter [Salmonella enterica]
MSIKTFIFSQPDKPIVKEKKEIDQTYKKFRFEIIASVFISYAVFYLTRKNFSAAMPAMLTETSLTAEDFAIMSSIFYILYGAMKFVGGMLVDKINPKAMTGPVLIGVGIVNILFGFSDSVAAFYVLYSLNAILQGTSFPPMAKIMASWFSKNERGRWWAIVEAAHNIGGSLAPLLTSFAIAFSGSWKMGFYVPGAISLLMGIVALFTIKDRPGTLGLPNVGQWRNDPTELAQVKASPVNLSFWQIFVKYILTNPLVWIIIIGDMSVYIARTILNDWPQIYYSQVHGWSLIKANSIISWFEAGGLAGGLLAGYLSDFMFKSNRWMTGLIFALALCMHRAGAAGSGYLLHPHRDSVHHHGLRLIRTAYAFCVGCLDVTHKDAAGSITGFRGLFSYVGAAMAGVPVIMVKNSWAWSAFISMR